MLTLPAAWREQCERGSSEPIYLVEIDAGARLVFTVEDYGAGGGEDATATHEGTDYTITEGVDFVAAASNDATAQAMAEAWLEVLPAGANVFAFGSRVFIVCDRADTLNGASSSTAAWSVALSTTPRKYVTGSVAYGDADAVVATVGTLAIEIDPMARGIARTGEREVVFEDDGPGCVVRNLLTEYPDLGGKIVRLSVGYWDLDEADFVDDGTYVISEVRRDSGAPYITLHLQDLGARLEGQEIQIDVINSHPLEAVEQILTTCGVPAALYDATTLDPTAYPDIGHWCVSRHHYGFGWNGVEGRSSSTSVEPRGTVGKRDPRGVYRFRRVFYERQDFGSIAEPVDALDLLNDLLQLLDGILAPGDDGVYRFSRYDAGATVVAALERGLDYQDPGQPEKIAGRKDHVQVKGPHPVGGNSVLYQVRDAFAQRRFAPPGGAPADRTLTIESDWLTAVAFPASVLSSGAGAGTILKVRHAQANGFSGLRHATAPVPLTPPATFAQDSNTTCTSSRLVYLLIFHTTDGRREIVSCDAADLDEVTSSIASGTWALADFTIAARGLFGTTAQNWDPTNTATANPNVNPGVIGPGKILVADVTMVVDVAERKLARFASGFAPVEISGAPWLMALEVGDLVTLSDEVIFDLGVDGVTSASIFEVIRKEPRFLGAGPGVDLRLHPVTYGESAPIAITRTIPTVTIQDQPPTNERSIQLDGVDDFVDYGDVDVFDNATSAMWAGWVRVLGSLHTADVWSRDDAGNEQFRLRLEVDEVSLEIGNATAKSITNDAPITLNTWHHLAVIYDGNVGVISIFVDGVKSTTTDTGTVPATLPAPTSSNLRLGAQSDSPETSYLAARLDEWMFAISFGAAFDEDDAAEAYNLGQLAIAGQMSFGVDHWFRFELSIDDSIGGLLGTPTGVPFFSTDTP